jgi:hypothetical protein
VFGHTFHDPSLSRAGRLHRPLWSPPAGALHAKQNTLALAQWRNFLCRQYKSLNIAASLIEQSILCSHGCSACH